MFNILVCLRIVSSETVLLMDSFAFKNSQKKAEELQES